MSRISVGLGCRVASYFSVSMLNPSISAIALTSASRKPLRRSSEQMGSRASSWGHSSGEPSKVTAPPPANFSLSDDFPSLGGPVPVAPRKQSRGRPAGQVPPHSPSKPQELQQRIEVDNLHLQEARQERGRQTNPNVAEQTVQQAYRSEAGHQQGVELEARSEAGQQGAELGDGIASSALNGGQESGPGKGGQQSRRVRGGQGRESANELPGGAWGGGRPRIEGLGGQQNSHVGPQSSHGRQQSDHGGQQSSHGGQQIGPGNGVQRSGRGRGGQGLELKTGPPSGVWNGRLHNFEELGGQQNSPGRAAPQSGQGRAVLQSGPGGGVSQSGRGRGGQRIGQGRGSSQSNSQGRDPESMRFEFIDALGRTLVRILRHQAAEMNLAMTSDGYVLVADLQKLTMKTRSHQPLTSYTVEDIKQAVQLDKKQRLGLKEDNGVLLIRANQGHTMESVKSEHLLKPILSAEEVQVCVHGTYKRLLDLILKDGLKRMTRNHVHFATGVVGSDGVISGMRASCNVLIYLNVEKALEDGMKLYISDNKVILTEGFDGVVPPKYFKEVVGLPGMKPIALGSVPT